MNHLINEPRSQEVSYFKDEAEESQLGSFLLTLIIVRIFNFDVISDC